MSSRARHVFPRRDTGVRRSRRESKSVHEFGNNNRLGFTVEPQNKQPRKHSRAPAPLSVSLSICTPSPPYRVNVTHQSHSELYTRRRFAVAWTNFPSVLKPRASQSHELNASIDETMFLERNIYQFRILTNRFLTDRVIFGKF